MSYCTTAELLLRTGSTLGADVLQAIIDDADREIDAWLAPRGLSGTSSGACKSASLELAKAGILDRMRLDGTQPDSSTEGDVSSSVQIEPAIKRHRATAFALLQEYVDAQPTKPLERNRRVMRVAGR
ncbi:MAG TPA: hypothetical protein HA263_08020 [Methanoregulaceae archaeon]|nr:hypothetical protein [Methanoregulaceae archaeon]